MIVETSKEPKEPAEIKKTLDRFAAAAYNNINLMKFISIAVDTFDRGGTMQLTLHVKSGEVKGGCGNFSF